GGEPLADGLRPAAVRGLVELLADELLGEVVVDDVVPLEVVRVLVALAEAELLHERRRRVADVRRHRQRAVLLHRLERVAVGGERGVRLGRGGEIDDRGRHRQGAPGAVTGRKPSGIPTKWTACIASTAIASARGSATPTSSAAKMIIRRRTNSGSSPPSSMRAIQYTAASGSEPRIDLMNAEMMP